MKVYKVYEDGKLIRVCRTREEAENVADCAGWNHCSITRVIESVWTGDEEK